MTTLTKSNSLYEYYKNLQEIAFPIAASEDTSTCLGIPTSDISRLKLTNLIHHSFTSFKKMLNIFSPLFCPSIFLTLCNLTSELSPLMLLLTVITTKHVRLPAQASSPHLTQDICCNWPDRT